MYLATGRPQASTIERLEYITNQQFYTNTEYKASVRKAILQIQNVLTMKDNEEKKEKLWNLECQTNILLKKHQLWIKMKNRIDNAESKKLIEYAGQKNISTNNEADAYNHILQHIKVCVIKKGIDWHQVHTLETVIKLLDSFDLSDDKTAFYKAVELLAGSQYYK